MRWSSPASSKFGQCASTSFCWMPRPRHVDTNTTCVGSSHGAACVKSRGLVRDTYWSGSPVSRRRGCRPASSVTVEEEPAAGGRYVGARAMPASRCGGVSAVCGTPMTRPERTHRRAGFEPGAASPATAHLAQAPIRRGYATADLVALARRWPSSAPCAVTEAGRAFESGSTAATTQPRWMRGGRQRLGCRDSA